MATRHTRTIWREGRADGYPLCCVLTYTLGHLMGADYQAMRRGTCRRLLPDGTEDVWVPCRWHAHPRRGPNWRSFWTRGQPSEQLTHV